MDLRAGWIVLAAVVATGCGSASRTGTGDAGAGGAAASEPVGAACTPRIELAPTFAGFNVQEVAVDAVNAGCGGGACLVNHFQGLTSCPYGQDSAGKPIPPQTTACTVPGTGQSVVPDDPAGGETVQPQCADRQASSTVYCSCRCANPAGGTDDGATYCTCPGSFTCTQLIPEIMAGDPKAGAYCIRDDTAYDPSNACGATCDPATHNCP